MKISVLSGILIICFSVITHAQQPSTDSISVTFKITVPELTPEDATEKNAVHNKPYYQGA